MITYLYNKNFFQENHLLSPLYEVPGTNISKVIIDEDVINKKEAPVFMSDLTEDTSSATTDIGIRNIKLNVTKSDPKVTTLVDSSPQS